MKRIDWRSKVFASGALVLGSLACVFIASAADQKSSSSDTSPDYRLPQVQFINEQVRQVWKDNNLTPSSLATDGEWCRRVYLDDWDASPR